MGFKKLIMKLVMCGGGKKKEKKEKNEKKEKKEKKKEKMTRLDGRKIGESREYFLVYGSESFAIVTQKEPPIYDSSFGHNGSVDDGDDDDEAYVFSRTSLKITRSDPNILASTSSRTSLVRSHSAPGSLDA